MYNGKACRAKNTQISWQIELNGRKEAKNSQDTLLLQTQKTHTKARKQPMAYKHHTIHSYGNQINKTCTKKLIIKRKIANVYNQQ